MADEWRSKKRRKIRSAPTTRPSVRLSGGFRAAIEEIVGPNLAPRVFAALPSGALPGTPAEFQEFERALLGVAREHFVGRLVVALLGEIHRHEDFVVWTMAAARQGAPLLRSRGDAEAEVLVPGGVEVRMRTPYMESIRDQSKPGRRREPGRRGKGGGGLFPVLAALGFVGRVSPCVASEVARSAALLASHEEAAESLKSQGLRLHPDTVRRIVTGVADAGLADRERTDPIDESFLRDKRVVIGIDGGRVRCRYEKLGRRLESGYHGYETPWQEPKVFTAYVVGEDGHAVRGELPIYEGTLLPWKDAMPLVATTLRRFGIQHAAQVAIAADGSENIWREVQRLMELLGIDRSRVVLYVDFYHAVEHIHEAARLSPRFTTDSQRGQWVRKQTKRLKSGRVEVILQDMAALPTADSQAAERLSAECEYFRSKKDLMRYDQLRRSGLPLGTGAIESVIRRVVNLRLKGPGIFWKPENAERMLYLRCRAKSGRWSEVDAALHRAALVPPRQARAAVLAHFEASA